MRAPAEVPRLVRFPVELSTPIGVVFGSTVVLSREAMTLELTSELASLRNDPPTVVTATVHASRCSYQFHGRLQPEDGAKGRFRLDATPVDEAAREFLATYSHVVLAVDDNPANLDVLRMVLGKEYDVKTCESAAEAMAVLERLEPSVIITDHRMPIVTGVGFLKQVQARFAECPAKRIVLSAFPDADEMRRFVNEGAIYHWLDKPLDQSVTLTTVRHAVEAFESAVESRVLRAKLEASNRRLRAENDALRTKLPRGGGDYELIGSSDKLATSMMTLDRVRGTDAPLHIHGETGTGKELVARAVHAGSARRKGPFIAQNCAGMTESLMQSTLFGYIKGAFTGADRDRPGVFQEADGGTLFLDEVGDLPLTTQAMLLRALQEQEIVPVGATRPVRVNVRVLSATHKDLRVEVAAHRFREDLYYRLVVLHMSLPPLRERGGDIVELATHFLAKAAAEQGKQITGLTLPAMTVLEQYRWPGNVRELANEITRAVTLADSGRAIDVSDLSNHLLDASSAAGQKPVLATGDALLELVTAVPGGLDAWMEATCRRVVGSALDRAQGNVSEAARLLGVRRQTLQSRLRALGLPRDPPADATQRDATAQRGT